MSFYQNVNYIGNNISTEPITWGNFKILGIEKGYPKDHPFYYFFNPLNQNWYNLIRGILTNDINLVRDNVNKVDILSAAQVITNDPNNRIKLFTVKEAKKYSNDEIVNFLRKTYDEKCLNATWFGSQKTMTSRGSFFTMIPSFDGEQPAKVRADRVKMLNTPILFDKIRIIGLPIHASEPRDEYMDLKDDINLQLLLAVASGNLEAVKDIVQSYPNVSTIQAVVTENFNELFLDLVYEANRLGFDEIVQCLEAVEKIQGEPFGIPFNEWLKSQKPDSELKLGEFVKVDTPMEED